MPIETCHGLLPITDQLIIVLVCSLSGLIWSIFNFMLVRRIDVEYVGEDGEEGLDEMGGEEKRGLVQYGGRLGGVVRELFLWEVVALAGFAVLGTVAVCLLSKWGVPTGISFLAGVLSTIILNYLSLQFLVQSTYRTTYATKFGLQFGYKVAYRSGIAINFGVLSLGMILFVANFMVLKDLVYGAEESWDDQDKDYYQPLFQSLMGYALGVGVVGSTIGIDSGSLAAGIDVGADLIGKAHSQQQNQMQSQVPLQIPNILQQTLQTLKTVTIHQSILYALLAGCLLLPSISLVGYERLQSCNFYIGNFMYVMLIAGFMIFVGVLASLVSTYLVQGNDEFAISRGMAGCVLVGGALMIAASFLGGVLVFPHSFTISQQSQLAQKSSPIPSYYPFICTTMGLLFSIIFYFPKSLLSSFFASKISKKAKYHLAMTLFYGDGLNKLLLGFQFLGIVVVGYLGNHLSGVYGVGLVGLGIIVGNGMSLIGVIYRGVVVAAHQIGHLVKVSDDNLENLSKLQFPCKNTQNYHQTLHTASSSFLSYLLIYLYLHNATIYQQKLLLNSTEPFFGILAGFLIGFMVYGYLLAGCERVGFQFAQYYAEINGQGGEGQEGYTGVFGGIARGRVLENCILMFLGLLLPILLGFSFGARYLPSYFLSSSISALYLSLPTSSQTHNYSQTIKSLRNAEISDEEGQLLRPDSDQSKNIQEGYKIAKWKNCGLGGVWEIVRLGILVGVVFGKEIVAIRGK